MPFEIEASGPDIPDGTYPAVLESVIQDKGQFGDFRKWTWLVEKDGQVIPLTCYTSAKTGPQTDSYRLLTGLIGKQPQIGERYEDPTGTRVLVTIVRNKKGFPKVESTQPFSEPQQVLPGVPR